MSGVAPADKRALYASMGPRSRERGDRLRNGGAYGHELLQWGRAHVSAEIAHHRREDRILELQLQWGRAHVSAEIRLPDLLWTFRMAWLQWGRAHVSAEIIDVDVVQELVFDASMGPRSRERGDMKQPPA